MDCANNYFEFFNCYYEFDCVTNCPNLSHKNEYSRNISVENIFQPVAVLLFLNINKKGKKALATIKIISRKMPKIKYFLK